jgi:hypothetical protein
VAQLGGDRSHWAAESGGCATRCLLFLAFPQHKLIDTRGHDGIVEGPCNWSRALSSGLGRRSRHLSRELCHSCFGWLLALKGPDSCIVNACSTESRSRAPYRTAFDQIPISSETARRFGPCLSLGGPVRVLNAPSRQRKMLSTKHKSISHVRKQETGSTTSSSRTTAQNLM